MKKFQRRFSYIKQQRQLPLVAHGWCVYRIIPLRRHVFHSHTDWGYRDIIPQPTRVVVRWPSPVTRSACVRVRTYSARLARGGLLSLSRSRDQSRSFVPGRPHSFVQSGCATHTPQG